MTSDLELVESALRILVAWTKGRKPEPSDVLVLREAFPSLAEVPNDELACQVVHDLSSRVSPKHEQTSQPQIGKQVA